MTVLLQLCITGVALFSLYFLHKQGQPARYILGVAFATMIFLLLSMGSATEKGVEFAYILLSGILGGMIGGGGNNGNDIPAK